jgi:hypothetical protein
LGGVVAVGVLVWPGVREADAVACAGAVGEVSAAVDLARTCDTPVEVLSGRTPWETLTALPSGELTWTSSTVAERALVDGGWRPVDSTLVSGSGGVSPVASVLPMRFSPGGSGAPLARLEYRGRVLEVLSPFGSLPAPVVAGPSVTYPSVLPDVDLVLTVNVDGTGFSQVLVVRTPAAAADARLARISFATRTTGLAVSESDGGLSAVDASGARIFKSLPPVMWDSSGAAGAGSLRARRPFDGDRVAAMGVDVAGTTVTVTPARSMLTDPSTKWPVYIDPTWDAGEGVTVNEWAMIAEAWPTTEYYEFAGNEGVGLCSVAVDSSCVSTGRKRLVWEFNIPAGIHGSVVSAATFSAYKTHAYSCSQNGWMRLYRVGSMSSSTNWSNHHANWDDGGSWPSIASQAPNGQCTGWEEWSALAGADFAADNSSTTLTLGLRAKEEDNMQAYWRRFRNDARLSITFNRYPNTPGLPSLEPAVTGGAGPSGFHVRDTTPNLSATVSDPDGGNVRGKFQVWNGGTKTWEGLSGYVASGGTAQVTVGTALSEGILYKVRVFGNDGALDSVNWSAFIEFRVDMTPPAVVPGVTPKAGEPAVYIEDGWAGGVSVAGKFTFTNGGVADVAHYKYSFNSTALNQTATLSGGANGQSNDVTFTPTLGGSQTLRVVSVDSAGWTSPERLYRFNVDFASEDAFWRLNEGTGTSAADTSGNGNTLTLSGPTWTNGPFADFGVDPADRALQFTVDEASTTGPVVETDASFSVMAFVKLDSATTVHAAVSQDGVFTSGFKLGHTTSGCPAPTGLCWAFYMFSEDSPTSAAGVQINSTVAVVTGEWVHLTGVYDATAGEVRVYVCELGTPAAPKSAEPVVNSGAYTSTGRSNGPVRVGRAIYQGWVGDHWPGAVDDVRLFDQVVSLPFIRDVCQGAA